MKTLIRVCFALLLRVLGVRTYEQELEAHIGNQCGGHCVFCLKGSWS